MSQKLSITDLALRGNRVLMRVDFNVPLDEKQQITDDTRIRASRPSIKHVLNQGASLILMSHLGRPKGSPKAEFSLKPCAERLSELLGQKVIIAPDCVGAEVENMASSLQPGQVLMLENLRFHPAEENPAADPSFTRQLSGLADVYINDAFGTAHREHSSTATITQYFDGKAAAGFLLQKEIEFIGDKLLHPKRPFIAIIGGAKISTKLGVVKSLLKKTDKLLIGGGMAFTFFKALGYPIGNSIHEEEMLHEARAILDSVKEHKGKLLLPVDVLAANAISEVAETRMVDPAKGIPAGFEGVDIGPETVKLFSEALQKAATVLWNGPLGVFEVPKFASGTRAIAETVARLKATTIVGGGDSIAALQQLHLADKVTHLSTGGGATLEYIEFGVLPGIEALSNK